MARTDGSSACIEETWAEKPTAELKKQVRPPADDFYVPCRNEDRHDLEDLLLAASEFVGLRATSAAA